MAVADPGMSVWYCIVTNIFQIEHAWALTFWHGNASTRGSASHVQLWNILNSISGDCSPEYCGGYDTFLQLQASFAALACPISG